MFTAVDVHEKNRFKMIMNIITYINEKDIRLFVEKMVSGYDSLKKIESKNKYPIYMKETIHL